jgi:hypothetical protein
MMMPSWMGSNLNNDDFGKKTNIMDDYKNTPESPDPAGRG